MEELELFSVVALTKNLPEKRLRRGQVGTIVEILAPSVYEMEFSAEAGHTYASVALRADQLRRHTQKFPIVAHPDVIFTPRLWAQFGS